ncbi:MAG: family N-acetyltransferase [Flavisolibacter sp.]|nr:family N-acetyltransferase [Flavisolibacter sp.]
MVQLIRTDSNNGDFIELVKYLDADLADRDGSEHSFYAGFNTVCKIKFVVVAYINSRAVGCGALKEYNATAVEIKRMYTSYESRGKGIATRIITELEKWATELNFGRCILETGKRQPEAIALYKKNGYMLTANYGQYVGIENSLCFEKVLMQ